MYILLKIRTKNSLKMPKNRQKTPIWGTLLGHSRIAVPLLFKGVQRFTHKKSLLKTIRRLFTVVFSFLGLCKLYFQHIFEHELIGEMCIYFSDQSSRRVAHPNIYDVRTNILLTYGCKCVT